MDKKIELLEDMIEIESKKSSFEFGKASERWKVYMDLNDPVECKEKIDLALGIKQYVKDLENSDDESKKEQKVEKFLHKGRDKAREENTEE